MARTPSESLEQVRAGVLRRPGLLSVALRDELADAYDAWLRRLLPDGLSGAALVAVGGLGRREPMPYSDLDLLLLHDGTHRELAALADSIWYPVWDSRIGLDHSVRTADQAFEVAREDVKALQGLLDLRFIGGDEELAHALRERVVELWRGTAAKRAAELYEISAQRWQVAGEGAFLIEPDLKDSHGGLRDVQSLRAFALAQLVDLPPIVRSANTLLLDVRAELQRNAGRAEDVLRQQEQDGIAAAFDLVDVDGDPDRDELLRRVNHCARVVAHQLDVAWHRIDAGNTRRPLLSRIFGSAAPVREGIARDVVAQAGEVVLAADADPRTDPGLVLRGARAAATHRLPFAAHTLDRLVAESAAIAVPWPAESRDDFVALLGTGRAAVPVLESLDLAGLLAPLIPEWDAVRSRAQRNPVHRFTVDRHLLETAAHAAEHTRDVARPDLLLMGALLHDIGKGYDGDHSVVGAEHARVIATRMGFAPAEVETISALARHHLLLPDTATRRDLDDPVTVETVTSAVAGSAELLDLLHALSIADAAATGPGAWSEWKAGLMNDLVRRAHLVLGGRELPDAPPVLDEERRALADAGQLAVVVRDADVIVAVPDAVGVLYRTTGVLALHSLDVRSASIGTYHSMAVNVFTVTPRFGRMPDSALLRADLARAMDGEFSLAPRLRAKEEAYGAGGRSRPPTVTWLDDAATDATVVEIRAEDRIGLLCRITAALERGGMDVRSARVSSLGGSVVDSFYVTTRDGKLVPPEMRTDVEIELRSV